MINQGNDVPEKTIAVFLDDPQKFGADRVPNIMSKPDKKRDWFTEHFYRCLPLAIGNQYGFIIKSEFAFDFEWNGGPDLYDTKVYVDLPDEESAKLFPSIMPHFGNGTFTINPPFTLRTPPGVNLMTMAVPNHVIPNLTVMTGVVEADNLRRNFTFNFRVQIPNWRIHVPAGTPLAAVMPIPRYYGDQFELKMAEDVFSPEVVAEEIKAQDDAAFKRVNVESNLKFGVGRDYYQGRDVYGNVFPDHQKP